MIFKEQAERNYYNKLYHSKQADARQQLAYDFTSDERKNKMGKTRTNKSNLVYTR